ncbi:MAG: hypothetical protein ACRDRV_18440 [Pseudonocardiaceae bacterium]
MWVAEIDRIRVVLEIKAADHRFTLHLLGEFLGNRSTCRTSDG